MSQVQLTSPRLCARPRWRSWPPLAGPLSTARPPPAPTRPPLAPGGASLYKVMIQGPQQGAPSTRAPGGRTLSTRAPRGRALSPRAPQACAHCPTSQGLRSRSTVVQGLQSDNPVIQDLESNNPVCNILSACLAEELREYTRPVTRFTWSRHPWSPPCRRILPPCRLPPPPP